MVSVTVSADATEHFVVSPSKKQKLHILQKVVGDKFETEPGTIGAVTVSPSLKLSKKPLQWWKLPKHSFSNLAKWLKNTWALLPLVHHLSTYSV